MKGRFGIAAGLLIACLSPAAAAECRFTDVPPGVRVKPPLGCEASRTRTGPVPVQAPAAERQKVGRTPGFIDLGNGTELRIGGRVRVDTVFHR